MIYADMDALSWMPFAQLGSFGLIAMAFIWFFWKGAPMLLQRHEDIVKAVAADNKVAITKLADDFRIEAHECREERMHIAESMVTEREKDRELRHLLNNTLQEVVAELHARK